MGIIKAIVLVRFGEARCGTAGRGLAWLGPQWGGWELR
jgi:hypothetical protein